MGPMAIEGGDTSSQISAAKQQREEDSSTFKNFNTVEQALKKKIIKVLEPMHLEILNDDMVGFANTSAITMIGYLFLSYGSTTAVDL
jgi:hypothetical protein